MSVTLQYIYASAEQPPDCKEAGREARRIYRHEDALALTSTEHMPCIGFRIRPCTHPAGVELWQNT